MEQNSEIEDKIFSRDVEERDLDVDTKPAHKYEGCLLYTSRCV